MDVCRPRSRRKAAMQRKRAPVDDFGPESKRRPTPETYLEASPDMSMITSTRRNDRSIALCDPVGLSPILPIASQEQDQQSSLQKRLVYESSPVVSRTSEQRSSDILFLSGDDDLFEWDEDDFKAKPNKGSTSPHHVNDRKDSHAKKDDANDDQNHERKDFAIEQKKMEEPSENTDDLWDDDDTFYAQLDISLIVAESQGTHQNGACTNSEEVQTIGMDNRSEPTTAQSKSQSNTGVRNLVHDCTESGERTSNVRTKEHGSAINKCPEVDRAVPLMQSSDKASISSVCTVTKDRHTTADVPVSRTKQDDETVRKGTPHQEKWFSHLSVGASDQRKLRRERTSMVSPVTRGRHTASDSHQTPRLAGASSRLKERLHGNAKVTTPTMLHHLLREAAVEEAMLGLADVQSAVKDKDIGPFYGLPRRVQELLEKQRGISQLYEWQDECLSQRAVKEGQNLIYSLPTSGGKTLVAEIIIMQQILCHQRDALLILPYVSIVQEKVTSLTPLAVELGFLVEEYAGSKGSIPPRKRRKKHALYVCTIEKAHTLVNCMIQEERMKEIGLVVVDELHMIGDGGRRGASLEICLSKLLYLNTCQILGMSATLSNISDLSAFMKAEVYTNNFRPVELNEYIKLEDNIFVVNPGSNLPEDEKFTHARTITFPYNKAMLKNDPDHLVGLALEVIPTNSCLFFCATKKNCQNVAENICRYIPRNRAKQLFQHKHKEKEELLLSLRRECDNNLCPTLKRTIPYGAAYHHGGLTMDERKLIEDAYSDGTLCLLTATSTLAAGVNLPAKRSGDVSSRFKRDLESHCVSEMLNGPIKGCYSSLMHDEGKGMRNLVLSLISLKITKTEASLQDFIKRTLCGIQAAEFQRDLVELAQNALKQVVDLCLVKTTKDNLLEVTRIGHAACKDLARPNWMVYMKQFSCLTESEHKVAELVGVSEFYMQCKMTGGSSKQFTPALERRAHRFYLTLMLWEMMKRKSIWEVAACFDTPRGFVQSVFTSAASFAFSVQRFCEDLEEFWAVHQLLSKLVYDLTYCATVDLMPLLEIPGVKQGRAKQLVQAGYKTLHHLAHADHKDLISKIDHLPVKIAKQIVAAAKMALAERIEALHDEAEELTSSPDLFNSS
nr:helicase POLQ-like [Lytechinus pictus]